MRKSLLAACKAMVLALGDYADAEGMWDVAFVALCDTIRVVLGNKAVKILSDSVMRADKGRRIYISSAPIIAEGIWREMLAANEVEDFAREAAIFITDHTHTVRDMKHSYGWDACSECHCTGQNDTPFHTEECSIGIMAKRALDYLNEEME